MFTRLNHYFGFYVEYYEDAALLLFANDESLELQVVTGWEDAKPRELRHREDPQSRR